MLFIIFSIDVRFYKDIDESEYSFWWKIRRLVYTVFKRVYCATYIHDGKGDSSAFYSLRKSGIEQQSVFSFVFLYVDSTMLSDQIIKYLKG